MKNFGKIVLLLFFVSIYSCQLPVNEQSNEKIENYDGSRADSEIEFSASDLRGIRYYGFGDFVIHRNGGYNLPEDSLIYAPISISVRQGQLVTVSGNLQNMRGNIIKEGWKDMRAAVRLTTGEVYHGTFKVLNWSDIITSFSLNIDNINTSGTIDRVYLHFPGVFSKFKFTNLKLNVSGYARRNPARFGFPNRTTAYPVSSTPIYVLSNNSDYSQENIESDVQEMFVKWRSKYLKSANFGNAAGKVGKYVEYGGGVEDMPDGMVPVTTSECHGWGMLILAHMDNIFNRTQSDFDAMVDYYLQWKSEDVNPILDWQQSVPLENKEYYSVDYNNAGEPVRGDRFTVTEGDLYTTPTIWNGGGENIIWGGSGGAADGDMDIAYALLIADLQWGSNGTHDYKELALDLIGGMERYYIANEDSSSHLLVATWFQQSEGSNNSSDNEYWLTRSSDFLLTHFNAFKKATNDVIWDDVRSRAKSLMDLTRTGDNVGVFPDFYVKENGSWQPASGEVYESENDGAYYWNACRTPWRTFLSLTHNQSRPGQDPYSIFSNAYRYNAFVKSKGGVDDLKTGYKMNGDEVSGSTSDQNMAFAAPAIIPSIYSYRSQSDVSYVTSNWEHIKDDANLRQPDEDEPDSVAYYGESVRLLTAIAYSGNWINP